MTQEQQQRVSFTPFLTETFDLQQLKRLIMYDIDDLDHNVTNLPIHMNLLFSQTAALFTPYENAMMRRNIDQVVQSANAFMSVQQSEDDSLYSYYRTKLVTSATEFLTEFSSFSIAHGLSFSLEKNKATTPFDLLKSIFDIDGYRNNSYGFPISYQQRILAEFILQRVQHKYDTILLIVGKRGRGKSTFAAEIMSTFLELEGKPFGLENIMLTESKEQMFNAVKTWKPGDGYIFDEAINQLFSRDFFKGSDFISLLTEIRYKRTLAIFNIPELFQIDKIVRESLADHVVQITERGFAVGSAPSLLSGEQRYSNAKPDQPVLTPQAHTDFLLKKSMNSIIAYPFWEIPSKNEFWIQYEGIKNDKINARKFIKPVGTVKAKRADDFYYELAILVANSMPNAMRLNEGVVNEYSIAKTYRLTIQGFAMWLSRQLGVTRNTLLLDTGQGICLDLGSPLVKSYLAKLKQLNEAKK